ncbi:hypothetical protein [Rubrimonas cliftonensis]|uniref:hypothetical protein n=1 Tax=Rubrimonas cliftonensis TaxID=89524 RepID=UPI001114FEFB|nr:hypothetical protein [Rubrimonas cliftonensis]
MRDDEPYRSYTDPKQSAMAIEKTITLIKDAWLDVFGEELIVVGGSPTERRSDVIRQLKIKLQQVQSRVLLIDELEVLETDNEETMFDILAEEIINPEKFSSIDDYAPNQVFQSIRQMSSNALSGSSSTVDISAATFLRGVIGDLRDKVGASRRLNVGRNRHFPRLLQYLREFAETSCVGGEEPFKIMNAAGKGKVAQHPHSPKSLKIRIMPSMALSDR